MNSFLITFKPSAENPERGWPLDELQDLVRRCQSGERVIEPWRFHNRKEVAIGNRVFLLLQGKGGPAVIGYGSVVGIPEAIAGKWLVPVQFESLVDPTREVLASKEDILAVEGEQRIWRTQASGVLLQESVARQLEDLVVGNSPKPQGAESSSNPNWTRDELIVALNFYLHHRPNPPGKESKQIRELTASIKQIGEALFPPESRTETFRNENGVYMKLMNFRRLDPEYTAEGKTGLGRGAKAEKEVWATFAHDPLRCEGVARAIVTILGNLTVRAAWPELDGNQGIQEAPEGKILTRFHVARERNHQLVESKRKQAMRKHGKLFCEVCEFDFSIYYGDHGEGFIECHHTKPVATFDEGHITHIDDLALVCANCHRMIHRGKYWLSIAELKSEIVSARLKGRMRT